MTEISDDGAFDAVERLTGREREILELFSQGLQNKVIATELSITEETVRSHAKSIYRKLRVRNRTGASMLLATCERPVPPALTDGLPEAEGYPERVTPNGG